jgi:hypothetical protein
MRINMAFIVFAAYVFMLLIVFVILMPTRHEASISISIINLGDVASLMAAIAEAMFHLTLTQ